ncbi:hypothetical protein DYB32_006161 [Aphanomyces invadans]|uniref:Endonuclease/exonuclease/phosphatase domain-containing protein n=1 Tax=Aphanomyces invadans TaxID=157072 RepID=A0A3R6YX14_9STRA|nr:hypothetical protein DYB32_006161 [Aphanomyces invadans]
MNRGPRGLSSNTLAAVLMTTQLGSELWRIIETLYADDDDMLRVLDTLLELHDSGKVDLAALSCVRVDRESARLLTDDVSLSVDALRTDSAQPLPGHHAAAKVLPRDLLAPNPTFTITTCNLNGLHRNGHLVAKRLKSPPSCLIMQETKFNNANHIETFRRHLTNEVGDGNYRLFVNDLRAHNMDTAMHRRCGVASFFHKSMAGFADLTHLTHLDVPGRYLVARTTWQGLAVYIHNIYAPTESQLRREFFQGLPRDFEDDSLHIVGGDFNIPVDPALDTTHLHPRALSCRSDCIEWLSSLRVLDVWRLSHPHERSYSGPGRVNRLDYIFVDHDLATQLSTASSYDANVHGGDHLAHTITLSNNLPAPTKGFWRLPRELLDDPTVVDAIKQEANSLLDAMNAGPDLNYGAMWYGWLKRIKSQLVKCHRQHLQASKAHLNYLKLCVAAAQRVLDRTGSGAEDVEASRLAYNSAREEYTHVCRDRQFDFHANSNERGTHIYACSAACIH